jgi:Transposase DDE domain
MTVNELIKLIPGTLFSDLAAETNVDHQVKKLDGETVFKLILFSMLNSDKLSLRVMETFLQSARFRQLAQRDGLDSRFNSIRDRICTINVEYFEGIYHEVFNTFSRELGEGAALSKTDSTYVSIASSLLLEGIKTGGGDRNFVKYSVNLKGSLPSSVQVFTKQDYLSEDVALSELIREDRSLVDNVVVYDRGLQSRAEFERFTNDQKWFVTRGIAKTRIRDGVPREVPEKENGSTVTIMEDQTGLLVSKKQHRTKNRYRVIKATIDQSGEQICFVTNMLEADAYQIASWYKQRWEIELFFKFIKQHLNAKHLVSRTENGIRVMVYMTMILAILIIAYKKLNKIKSIKMAKLRFEIELDNEMVREIVILCGGDPEKASHLWKHG